VGGLARALRGSAGKRHSTRIRHATPWLKTTLAQAAFAATRKKAATRMPKSSPCVAADGMISFNRSFP
jgi:hypothetical protein